MAEKEMSDYADLIERLESVDRPYVEHQARLCADAAAALRELIAQRDDAIEIGVEVIRERNAAQAERDVLKAENDRLRRTTEIIPKLDCRYTASGFADIDGMHCPLKEPCARCERDRRHEQLRISAQAVVDRWHSPAWKEAHPTAVVMNDLRDVLSGVEAKE